MRWREIGWGIFLAGLPLSAFLNRRLDLWHAQTAWVQAWLLVLAVEAGWHGRSRVTVPRSLLCWATWLTLMVWWRWQGQILQTKVYPTTMLFGLVHVASVVAFYVLATATWTLPLIQRLLRWLAWVAVLVTAYGWLQVFNLDEFFTNWETPARRDLIVGTIGNPTHFGAWLTLLVPVVWLQRRRAWGWRLALAGMVGLVVLTHSTTAVALVLGLGVGWSVVTRRWWLLVGGTVCGLGLAWLCGPTLWREGWLGWEGRLEAWQALWPYVQQRPITGWGVGFMAELSRQITEGPLHGWRHAHNEWLQVWLEQGLIGVGLLAGLLVETVRRSRTVWKVPEAQGCGVMLAIFLVWTLVSFPCHLWMLGSLGLVALCGVHRLATPES